MYVIYKITNKENGKSYIGQTNNYQKRLNHYKSSSFNPNSSDYNRPIHSAIRKYGLDKFDFSILEEIDSKENQEFVDDREIYFIDYFKSLTTKNGYNVQSGGQGNRRMEKLSYEERLKKSNLFSVEDIKQIQKMLIDDKEFDEIEEIFPQLKRSFLLNINCGLNFVNDYFDYPLKKNSKSKFSQKEIQDIKQRIKAGESYKSICAAYKIQSQGFLSMINTGKCFFDEKESYPLYKSKFGGYMAKECQKHLIFDDWSMCKTKKEIYEKVANIVGYNQIESVKKINLGFTRKNKKLLYPLLNNQEKNKHLLK